MFKILRKMLILITEVIYPIWTETETDPKTSVAVDEFVLLV